MDSFWGADFFHADIFAAPQEPDFRDTIKNCVNNVADGAVPPAVCRPALRATPPPPSVTPSPSSPPDNDKKHKKGKKGKKHRGR